MLLIDVRSPSEFQQGHAPEAVSLPLFDDAERHAVGLCFAEHGQDAAVRLGLSFVGPKMHSLVAFVDEHCGAAREVSVYCWRGGMRSGSVAWLLGTAGYRVNRWEGGYKVYRNRVLAELERPRPYRVLTGHTGVGKTEALATIADAGLQVLDLERLANHRGSAFGHVGLGAQPTSEQFENYLVAELATLDSSQPIWVEDESQSIGRVWLQPHFFKQLQNAPRLELVRSAEERAQLLARIYGEAPADQLKNSFTRLARKIGGQWVPVAHQKIDEGQLAEAAALALRYYDKTYAHSMARTETTVQQRLDLTGLLPDQAQSALMEAVTAF